MRGWVLGFGLWVGVAALACEPASQVTTLPLALRPLGSCPLGAAPDLIEVTALGDFPSRSTRVAVDAVATAFERLPAATRELSVRVTTPQQSSVGRHVLQTLLPWPASGGEPLWLLPPERSCLLADTLVRTLEGAVAVPLPGASLLVAGGKVGPTLASSDALLLHAGTEAGVPVPGGMLLRRAFASASVLRDRVVVAGGTADLRGTAHDTYEVFSLSEQRFDASLSDELASSRMQHGAAVLADGRLLLVGGRMSEDDAPLATAELIELRTRKTELLAGVRALNAARVFPSVLTLDSGTVLVLAGRDERARVRGSIERFEASELRFSTVLEGLLVHAEVAVAVLPGA
ncbi:MAG: hypothetical protein RL701_3636, partial [Pseudomonadota bacterium]